MTLSLTDQLGTTHSFKAVPQRIVSLVPSQTELLFDLGLEKELIGITKFCIHPKHLKTTKTIVGGTKTVNYSKIKALKPDLIIANKEENTKEMVTLLQEICTVWVTDICSISANLKMIHDFGLIFNQIEKAEHLICSIELALNKFEATLKDKSPKKVAYFIWANPYMVAGDQTFINEMLHLNKLKNAFANQKRYVTIPLEALLELKDLDYIFLSSEPFPFKEKHAKTMAAFVPKAKIMMVNGESFSWYGSRLLAALDDFKIVQSKL